MHHGALRPALFAAPLLLAAAAAAPIVHRGPGVPEGCSPDRVFVVSVGVDYAPMLPNLRLQFAESDAVRMGRHMAWTYQHVDTGGPTHSAADAAFAAARAAFGDTASDERVRIALLTGAEATPAALAAAVAHLAVAARPDDAVVFYFGGISASPGSPLLASAGFNEQSANLLGTSHTLFLGAPDSGGVTGAGSSLVSVEQLGRWMDNVSARSQLFVFEAGEGREFLADLVAALADARPNGGILGERERVFVGTQSFGLEHGGGGPLLRALEERRPLDLLGTTTCDRNTPEHALASAAQTTLAADSIAGRSYARIFREREFLEIYSRVQAMRPASRGLDGMVAPAEPIAIGSGSVALVVGTDVYDAPTWARLRNPVHDAETLAAELSGSFGFDMLVLRNPTQGEFLSTLRNLAKREFAPNDELLVFVAGHGYYDELLGAGYLVFRDSRPVAEDENLQTYLPHKLLETYVNPIGSEHTLVMLDACFGGAFAERLSSGGSRGDGVYEEGDLSSWLRRRLEHKSRLYLTSGGKEYVSDGIAGSHSPFMRRLLGTLRAASTEGRPLSFAQLQAGLERVMPEPRAGDWGSHVPGGDFVLIPASAGQ